MANILIYALHYNGAINKNSLGAVSEGAKLAAELGGEAHAILLGENVPDALAALGYDSANVAFEAMRRAPDLSGPAVRDAIAGIKDFPGIAGTISIDAQRNSVKPAVVLQVASGKFKYVTTIAP